ncbi:MAG: AraC family transcriptional regulator [Syntrophaceae bacterium]|nr:AraC family transcriptional regulator [Syntrophaceae bacterium]
MQISLKSKPVIPQYRSMHATRILVRLAQERGINVTEILKKAGISDVDLDNPDKWVTFDQEISVYMQIVDLVTEPDFGLTIGQNYHIGHLGEWIMAVNCCTNALEAWKTMFELIDLVPVYFQYILEAKGNVATFCLHEITDWGTYRRFLHEAHAVGFYYICCEIMREKIPLIEVRFAYSKPPYADKYGKIFNCPIFFDAAETEAIFDAAYLKKNLPCSNILTKKLYEKECWQVLQNLNLFATTAGRVRYAIMSKNNEFPNMKNLAKSLNMSSQTMRRRLAAEGMEYKSLSRQVREDKACALLTSTNMTIEEIADSLGYSDVANFHRAFKSWTGQTPLGYRRKEALNRVS